MMKKTLIGVLLAASLLSCGVTLAQARDNDLPGSKDHPLISRYLGCFIDSYETSAFEQFNLALAKAADDKFEKSLPLEGKITRIGQECPEGRSALEVYCNIESGLKGAGFNTLFTCTSDDCGRGIPRQKPSIGNYEDLWNYGVRYHLTAKLARPEGDVFVHIGVWQDSRPYAEYDVIEVKRMMTGLATVNAAALAEISKLLQQDASLKIYVVGHTDNVGALASNMDLSRRRADAVVKVLIAKYNIPAARLNAQGAGPIAPVASNDTEEGRAKNRRVELVKQ